MSQLPATEPRPFLINGKWISNPEDAFDSVNPASGELNYRVSVATSKHVEDAVAAARTAAAQPAWKDMLPHVRAQILMRIAALIVERGDELAKCQMIENGKVWKECKAQAGSAAATFRYYAAVCETLTSEVTPSRGNYLTMTSYEPYGVVAAITPWNSPLTMEAQKVAPALAAGNAVILKPSEVTPSAALLLGEIALQAGLPPGILNVLTGNGATTGKALVQHPGVRMVSFTGGTASGRAIGMMAAERLIPVALELGGKSPHIVFEDANLDAAVENIIGGIFEGSGQSCVAGSRLFVQRSVHDKLLDLLIERSRAIKVGAPTETDSEMGPVSSFAHRSRIEQFIESATAEGGKVLLGGKRPEGIEFERGAYFLPTILGGLDNQATAVREEIFGPVLCVLPFDDEADLIKQANDSAFGLASGIWTANYQRAWRVARALETGLVWINTYKQLSISTPFGGFKDSGIGREKGASGLRLYQQSKGIYWSMDAANFPAS
ncbi:aldehyde dehydrogenase [Pollutimonas nitritireducens]|uniref:Aldehyde dehydrogenase n=1 Tax=Pollutimonas nitritireducens TaxID=2045209 RepID=A0A2N4UCH1_9BURK|nr:aldehyde dehydrogenase [Pollutimonas nitritireducens]PLC52711.1 aldehyde dehydrogenase [Pollutimonas nitritireducens]